MDRDLNDFLNTLEQFGHENDARETDRRRKMLNLERETAALVHILVAAGNRRDVLEIGTSNGYSTLWLSHALRSSPTARITSIELDATKIEMARENLQRAGLADRVTLMQGSASEIVKALPGPFDCVLFDADRISAPDQLHTLLRSWHQVSSCCATTSYLTLRKLPTTCLPWDDFRISSQSQSLLVRDCTSRFVIPPQQIPESARFSRKMTIYKTGK